MKKYLMILAAVAVAAPAYIAFQSHAEDVAVEVEAVEVQEATLADGTIIHIKGEEVFVVDADGNETPAPDGEHTLEDGSTVTTLEGKIVTGEESVEEAVEE